jgi:peptidoglycan/xylan/chitin deacetylase (PgdA/CDA1 family)
MSATKIAKVVLGGVLGSGLTYRITDKLLNGPKMPYVRALNYHDTPQQFAANFRKQLQWYSRHFVDCNQQQLRKLLDSGAWSNAKPGLIISFDDGLKSNYEIAAPLLEEFGFTGWFMIPVSFLDAGIEEHAGFAATNNIAYNAHLQAGNLAMSWDDVHDLEKRGHVITCHSMNHRRLSDSLTDEELQEEIERSKAALESRLGHPVSGFTWVGGEESSYSRRAYQSIVRANYTEVFCTNCEPIVARQNPLFLERSNIEANFGLNQVRLVLGGLYDRKYAAKRQRVFKLLTT